MATEQEELKLVVTLVDNASAGLGKLQDQIKELGGGSSGGNKHIQKLDEQSKALSETVMKMTGSFGEAFKSLGMLRLGFIGGVAGVAAFGYEMAKQLKDLGAYTDKIRGLGQLGKDIGVNPAAIKSIAEQLAVYGVGLDQATAATSKFAQKMAELQRDPRVRFGILGQTANTPQAQAAMREGLDALNKAVTVQDKLNIARQMYENIRQNALKRGESPERAADEARKFMEALNYDPVLTRAGQLKNLTDEQKKSWDEIQKAADHYSETLGKIAGNFESIDEVMKRIWTRWATPPAEWLEHLTGRLKEGVEKAEGYKGGAQQFYKDLKKQGEDSKPHDFEGRWPGANDQFRQMPNPRLQNQSYRSSTDSGNALLQHVAFVNEEQKKGVDANTDQLKRLNDMLAAAMGLNKAGGGTGGGGIINAAYTTSDGTGPSNGIGSRGSTPRFGSKEYPNLGDPGSGAPNGSHVGAGSGAGAGETPAGPPGGGSTAPSSGNRAAQRAGFMKELNDNPRLKDIAIDAMKHEGGIQSNMEQLFNMAAMRHQTIRQALYSGQYGPMTGRNRDPNMGNISAALRARGEAALAKVGAGSNITDYATDQGMAGDPNFARYMANREHYGMHKVEGAWFSAHGEPGVRWAQQQRARDANAAVEARRQVDGEQAAATKVEGSGKIRVDVNAPKGTSVSAESSGLFNTIETYRQTQMAAAARGPARWGQTPQ